MAMKKSFMWVVQKVWTESWQKADEGFTFWFSIIFSLYFPRTSHFCVFFKKKLFRNVSNFTWKSTVGYVFEAFQYCFDCGLISGKDKICAAEVCWKTSEKVNVDYSELFQMSFKEFFCDYFSSAQFTSKSIFFIACK